MRRTKFYICCSQIKPIDAGYSWRCRNCHIAKWNVQNPRAVCCVCKKSYTQVALTTEYDVYGYTTLLFCENSSGGVNVDCYTKYYENYVDSLFTPTPNKKQWDL